MNFGRIWTVIESPPPLLKWSALEEYYNLITDIFPTLLSQHCYQVDDIGIYSHWKDTWMEKVMEIQVNQGKLHWP